MKEKLIKSYKDVLSVMEKGTPYREYQILELLKHKGFYVSRYEHRNISEKLYYAYKRGYTKRIETRIGSRKIYKHIKR